LKLEHVVMAGAIVAIAVLMVLPLGAFPRCESRSPYIPGVQQ
jgi:hypothetical protein